MSVIPASRGLHNDQRWMGKKRRLGNAHSQDVAEDEHSEDCLDDAFRGLERGKTTPAASKSNIRTEENMWVMGLVT
jgi:hypothetical protein